MEIIPTISAPRQKLAEEFRARKTKTTWAKYDDYLQSWEWRQSRDAALKRAGWKCQRCESKRALQVHHKSYERLGEELPADLEVLCQRCHTNHHIDEWSAIASVYAAVVSSCLAREKFTSLSDLLEAVKVECATKHIEYDNRKVWQAVRLVDANRRGVIDAPKPRAVDVVDVTDSRPVTHKEAVAFLQKWGFSMDRFSMCPPPISHCEERTRAQIEEWRREQRIARPEPPVPPVKPRPIDTNTLEQIAEWKRQHGMTT